jgi:pimeloyl-ACP methyl ester carboxylesterase
MPIRAVNGVQLFWEEHGESDVPLILVHGSWGDHHNWDLVVPGLARQRRVFTYDRRGHSLSERPSAQGNIEEDVADLSALIQSQKFSSAHVAGNSFGAAIALKLAAVRPHLFASLVVHEPPLIGMLADDPALPFVRHRIAAVLDTLHTGDLEAGARQFVETVALGPGAWEKLPAEQRRTFVFNAPTWVDEMQESESAFAVDLARLSTFTSPLLMTQGDQSPPFFGVILETIASVMRQAQRHTFHGAGHVPHLSHPDEYVRVVTGFLQRADAA